MKKKTKKIILIVVLIIFVVILLVMILQRKKSKISEVKDQTAKATVYTRIGDTQYDITNSIEQNIKPTLSAGMIPIKPVNEFWEIASENNWYNYSNGLPAYMMLNDSIYQSEEYYNMPDSKKIAKNNVGTQIQPNDLGSIYMWIPKFAYNEDGNIIYIKQEANVAGEYTIPDVFYYELNGETFLLSGIWVEINELQDENTTSTKVLNLNKGESDTTYGFLAHTKAIKMTEDTKKATQIFINYGLKGKCYCNITNENHTILQIIDTTKTEYIKGTAIYNDLTEKVEIEVTYHKNDIVKILNSSGRVLSENSLTADSGDDLIGNGKYQYIVIDNKGNMKIITAHVTGLNIYVIPDWETLKQFRDDVNANKVPSGTKVYQTADIKVNEGKYTIDSETGEITFAEDAENWTPIGVSGYQFSGIYDGMDHTISGIYCDGYSGTGLFGTISDPQTKIKNLTLAYSWIKSNNSNAGGIISYYSGGKYCVLENVISEKNYICSSGSCGGLIGYCDKGVKLNKCKNTSKVITTGYGKGAGGIIGSSSDAYVEQSFNKGYVEGYNSAGIVAWGSNITIEKCYNTGNINGTFPYGITQSGTINNSYNIGEISGYSNLAGIAQGGSITNCYNAGEIKSSNSGAGITYSGGAKNSFNKGKVTGTYELSGITSYGNHSIITASYNNGEVSGTDNEIAGILSDSYYATASDCYNTGKISGYSRRIGGIAGFLNRSGIEKCYNVGELFLNEKRIYNIAGDYETISTTYILDKRIEISDFDSGKLIESDMKNIAQRLNEVKDNEGNVTEIRNVWKNDTIGINNGYPILWWQTNNDELNLLNMSPNETSTYHDTEYIGAFMEDTEGINNGYPILKWQVE